MFYLIRTSSGESFCYARAPSRIAYRSQFPASFPCPLSCLAPCLVSRLVPRLAQVLKFGDDMVVGTRTGQAQVSIKDSGLVFVGSLDRMLSAHDAMDLLLDLPQDVAAGWCYLSKNSSTSEEVLVGAVQAAAATRKAPAPAC